jgi:hypothetical protein
MVCLSSLNDGPSYYPRHILIVVICTRQQWPEMKYKVSAAIWVPISEKVSSVFLIKRRAWIHPRCATRLSPPLSLSRSDVTMLNLLCESLFSKTSYICHPFYHRNILGLL